MKIGHNNIQNNIFLRLIFIYFKKTKLKNNVEILEIARQTLQTEAEGIRSISRNLNADFSEIVYQILYLKTRVIITGIGKSGIIAQKIVATFNSTGTPFTIPENLDVRVTVGIGAGIISCFIQESTVNKVITIKIINLNFIVFN